ncbi:hypothetical protein [Roseivirga sp. E12]|uniref:LolA family protein n=1 Tax=Roseivirga sp. E12 TaxID=2819237 RepID=UPI001ABCF330|nr:hypothetical protein [Roseivirga sp. E12]MBO3700309.1 hypothetical protein [Roseivirga sp. E12]
MKKLCLLVTLALFAFNTQAQDASNRVKILFDKYAAIPNYKVDITYQTSNDRMGFSNTQKGVLVVEGEKYILKFGPNETWLNDGKTEYVGTKEEDHSQIMYFCPGKNSEAMIDFGKLTIFYGTGHRSRIEGRTLTLTPTEETTYVQMYIETTGEDILSLSLLDDFGTMHKYTLSGFTTETAGTKFVIDPSEYEEKIFEREGCQ